MNNILPLAIGALMTDSFPPDAASIVGAPAGKPLPARRKAKHNGRAKGAFGGPSKKARKEAFLAESSQQAKTLANEKGLRRAYAEWRAGMTPAERAQARKLKVLHPMADGDFAKPGEGAPDIDFHDPADLPECAVDCHPVDGIEPQSDFSVAIASLGSDEVTAAADDFSEALTWALDVPDQRDLVGIGLRALVMIDGLRPELVGDFVRPPHWMVTCAGFDNRTSAGLEQHLATGEIFGRVLEWVRRGDRLSAIGERLCLVAYVVRPTMINSPTLARLGEVMNKTRQAKDKLVTCLRDTFAGLKAAAQRGERTRLVCQNAH